MKMPEGWTDDMRIRMDPSRSVADLVQTIMEGLASNTPHEAICADIAANYGVHDDDLGLALDRVRGGIVRAMTGIAGNEPSSTKDPLAWSSFQAVWTNLPRRGWFSRRREPGGPWQEWLFEELRRQRTRR